jgi:hypothetical protein
MDDQSKDVNEPENQIATNLLRLGAVVIVIGIIGGFIILGRADDMPNDILAFLTTIQGLTIMVSSVMGGSLFIGISEIINQLFEINEKRN